MRSYGCIKSRIIGNELDADNLLGRIEMPSSYKLKSLKEISDQGTKPICVSVSLNTILDWKLKTKGIKKHYSDSIFYDASSDATSKGMSPKDAFKILAEGKNGLPSGFNKYAMVKSSEVSKRAILQSGPVMIALPVKSTSDIFWKGDDSLGGHAVTLVGFNNSGFILRNSWGTSYGNGGYIEFPYDDFKYVYEAWTLIS